MFEVKVNEGAAVATEAPVIIYVEDDILTREDVERELADAGFQIIAAVNGEEALTHLADKLDDVVGLLTDINLGPGIDGWEVAHQARLLKSSLPIVYVSGRESGEWTAKGVPESIMIGKPFVPAQIVVAISCLLNAGTPHA